MIPTREQMSELFHDTLKFFDEDATLREAVATSSDHTKVYPADFAIETDSHKAGKIRVTSGRTFQTALKLHDEFPHAKIAVLNFAASQHPGGGVFSGSRAQEESLCRSSTLYPSLKSDVAREGFYSYHHDNECGWLASDTCIYSSDVIICRDDDDYIPARLKPEDFVKVDVITCAAPHIFHNINIADDELYAIHISRAKNILRVCAYNGADILIAGAFGCGAFHNPAEIVAGAWREALKDYRVKFDLVVFAVKSHKESPNNFDIFSRELSHIIM
ncbi:MAG: TIGR02452 family protein [Synergistaceae bacterium]|nr:TIGR02452 family protein [Synergistaceae bacterium]